MIREFLVKLNYVFLGASCIFSHTSILKTKQNAVSCMQIYNEFKYWRKEPWLETQRHSIWSDTLNNKPRHISAQQSSVLSPKTWRELFRSKLKCVVNISRRDCLFCNTNEFWNLCVLWNLKSLHKDQVYAFEIHVCLLTNWLHVWFY